MRLFTALWPAPEAVTALRAAMPEPKSGPSADGWPPEGWLRTDPASWHLTLVFHGEARMGPLARRMEAAYGASAPRLRTRGAGAFPTVRWAGIEAEPTEGLAELVDAVGGDPAAFVAHVTVLRRRARAPAGGHPEPPVAWADHVGPWWRPAEVLLVASEPARGGVRYRPVHRVPLAGPDRGVADG